VKSENKAGHHRLFSANNKGSTEKLNFGVDMESSN